MNSSTVFLVHGEADGVPYEIASRSVGSVIADSSDGETSVVVKRLPVRPPPAGRSGKQGSDEGCSVSFDRDQRGRCLSRRHGVHSGRAYRAGTSRSWCRRPVVVHRVRRPGLIPFTPDGR